MSDVNIHYSLQQKPQENRALTTTWSCNGLSFFPGPANTVVLHRAINDARMIAQPDLAHALRQCNHFRSIEQHIETITSIIPALREDPEDVRATLDAVRSCGLLESSEDAWSRLTQTSTLPAEAPCRVFILTCDRPMALERLLRSINLSALPGSAEGIWVIDDSREPASVEENQGAIEAIRSESSMLIHHFELKSREQLIRELCALLSEDAESIHFLLSKDFWSDTPTYGLARNLALLLSVGKLCLILDDDTILEAVVPPIAAEALKLGTANDRQATFYNSVEALERHTLTHELSPLRMMAAHLGQPLFATLGRELPGHQALAGWDGQLLNQLQNDSPILLTQCGSWGDPGTGSGNWIFNLGVASIKRLLESGADIEAILGARSSWLGYRGPMLTEYGTLSQLTGLDNTALLPPYLPAGRGEDLFFGLLLRRLHPTSIVFNEGWAIRHQPLEDRGERGQLYPMSAEVSQNTLGDWIGRAPADQWGLSPERRLIGIAEQIERLSEMSLSALEKLAQQESVSKATSLLRRSFEHLESAQALQNLAGYRQWQTFLESSRDRLVNEIQMPNEHPLARVTEKAGSADRLREKGVQFTQALRAWPRIRDAAAQLINS